MHTELVHVCTSGNIASQGATFDHLSRACPSSAAMMPSRDVQQDQQKCVNRDSERAAAAPWSHRALQPTPEALAHPPELARAAADKFRCDQCCRSGGQSTTLVENDYPAARGKQGCDATEPLPGTSTVGAAVVGAG